MITKSLEEYIKTMYLLKQKKHIVRVTDIAEKMNCTKASVNKALKILKQENLVNYETYGKIEITEEGEKLARKVLEAYDIIYLFLTEILKLDIEIAEIESKNIKMSLKDETLNQLAKYVHKELGLYDLNCGYDINNTKCLSCLRTTSRKKNEYF